MSYYFSCPNCGVDDGFVTPVDDSGDLGCLLLLLGGIIPFLLFANHQRGRVQCTHCYRIFHRPAVPRTSVAKFAGWVAAWTIIALVAGLMLYTSAELAESLPETAVISAIEETIVAAPRVTAYVVTAWAAGVLISCVIAANVANARYRRELSTKVDLTPPIGDAVRPVRKPQPPREE